METNIDTREKDPNMAAHLAGVTAVEAAGFDVNLRGERNILDMSHMSDTDRQQAMNVYNQTLAALPRQKRITVERPEATGAETLKDKEE